MRLWFPVGRAEPAPATRAFYVAVLEKRPETFEDFREAVEGALADVPSNIKAIHIVQ
jgi:hypothetical protein